MIDRYEGVECIGAAVDELRCLSSTRLFLLSPVVCVCVCVFVGVCRWVCVSVCVWVGGSV